MPGEIVAIGGLPGSGKTSHVQPYLDRGYTRVKTFAERCGFQFLWPGEFFG